MNNKQEFHNKTVKFSTNNKDKQLVQEFPQFNTAEYWRSIAYSKENHIDNHLAIKKIDYKLLNTQRSEFRKIAQTSKIFKILDSIVFKSISNPNATFSDLYNLLQDSDLLFESLGRITKNKGSFTPGIDPITIDKITQERIQEIQLELKNNSYEFQPVRRVYIPKPGKPEPRPLGIPTLKDRILQEAIRMILESIYEPNFEKLNVSFGYIHIMLLHISKYLEFQNL